MPIWKSQTKNQCPSLVHNLPGKAGRSYLIQDVKWRKLIWLLEDLGVKENGARMWTTRKYSPIRPRIKLWTIIRVENCCKKTSSILEDQLPM